MMRYDEMRSPSIFNRYLVAMVGLALGALLIVSAVAYKTFFVCVPPGYMLIVTAKNGNPKPPGAILAKPGEQGIQEDVLGEGLHFMIPVIYETELRPLINIPPGKIGVVTAKVGKEPPPGAILVDDDARGPRRRVLTPGNYRMNPYGYEIKLEKAVEILAGYAGIVTSKIGRDAKGRFAADGERGVRRAVLQPGMYYLNPNEFDVQTLEVGVHQVNFTGRNEIRFPSRDAFDINIEATVEWELLPDNAAKVLMEFGNRDAIEEKVIVPQSKSIGRIQGSSYGAKDFLLGNEREKFQTTFTAELERTCASKSITIHSAFIRHLSIPDNLLLPIRQSFIAVEKEKTAKAWDDTKKTAGDLEREKALIVQRRAEVKAQTDALVKTIEAEADQEVGSITAQMRLLVAQKQQEIASVEAQKTVVLGEARAKVVKLSGAAQAAGFDAKIKAFGDSPQAFANYSFAQKMPTNLNLKLIYSGNGTLWTDLEKTAGVQGLGAMKLLQGGDVGHAVAPAGPAPRPMRVPQQPVDRSPPATDESPANQDE